MGSRDGVLTGQGQKRWYSDWTGVVDVLFSLDMGRKDDILTDMQGRKYYGVQRS